MKKTIRLNSILGWLAAHAAIVVLFSGCATPPERSYNADFGVSLPTAPTYYIHDESDGVFKITVSQGRPSSGAERVMNVKEAASAIAKAESQRLGWEKWELNYIREENQGWMHMVVAEVKRIKYIAPALPQAGGKP